MKNSYAGKSIKVTKRSAEGSPVGLDEASKKSINIGQALEYERSMTQTYRQKNERNIVKCRFLYNKLTALGNLQGVPEMFAAQVSEVDVKIKQLQFQLQFKRSQQMKKLRKKVSNFLEQINFEVSPEDMDKIEDEIQIILFLIDIFEEKFNEMTAERSQINEIIGRLEQNSTVAPPETDFYKKQNQSLLQKITLLEAEIQKLKNQDIKKLQANLFKRQQGSPASESILVFKNQEIERAHKRIQDLQTQHKEIEAKYQILSNNLERSKRQQARWKQRYRLMQSQKSERIKLLEESIVNKPTH